MESKLRSARRAIELNLLSESEYSAIAARLLAKTSPLTNRAIHRESRFSAKSSTSSRWLADGSGAYALIEDGEIVKYDAVTSVREVIVSTAQLTLPGASAPLKVDSYEWNGDGTRLLILTNATKVWRRKSRGDYYVMTLIDGVSSTLQRVGGGDAATDRALYYAKFSPGAGDLVGYVFENNIYVHELTAAAATQLSTDGLPGHGGMAAVINGNFDWVYEEELSLSDGWRWSPDGRKIAWWQLRTDGVEHFPLVDLTTNAPYADVTHYPYPKVGSKNPVARIAWISVAAKLEALRSGDVEAAVDPSGDATPNFLNLAPAGGGEHYLARMEWAANSEAVCVQRLPRRQNQIDVLLCACTENGGFLPSPPRIILAEQDECWLDVHDSMKWLEGGTSFTWLSERSGHRHIYVVSRDGKVYRDITAALGDTVDVLSVDAIDDVSGWVYFTSTLPTAPTERYLYRASLASPSADDPGALPVVERVTPAGDEFVGSHSYRIAPSGAKFATWTMSKFGDPPIISIISLPDHRVIRLLEDNAALRRRLDTDVARGPCEFISIDTQSTEIVDVSSVLDGYAIFPPGFTRERAAAASLPVLVYVYGEPASTTVRNAWGGNVYMWHLLMAQRGYVVVSFDSRGTPAPKGRLWRKSVYRKIGVTANNDQAAAVSQLLVKWPFLDPKRVGVWGWSGGGSSTLQAMFRFPKIYRAGAAIAFIADQRLYDTCVSRSLSLSLSHSSTHPHSSARSPLSFLSLSLTESTKSATWACHRRW